MPFILSIDCGIFVHQESIMLCTAFVAHSKRSNCCTAVVLTWDQQQVSWDQFADARYVHKYDSYNDQCNWHVSNLLQTSNLSCQVHSCSSCGGKRLRHHPALRRIREADTAARAAAARNVFAHTGVCLDLTPALPNSTLIWLYSTLLMAGKLACLPQ